jgi:hypothetical protein
MPPPHFVPKNKKKKKKNKVGKTANLDFLFSHSHSLFFFFPLFLSFVTKGTLRDKSASGFAFFAFCEFICCAPFLTSLLFFVWFASHNRTITASYYRGAHAIIVCYSINDILSFEKLSCRRNFFFFLLVSFRSSPIDLVSFAAAWFDDIKHYSDNNISLICCGNKCDLKDERTVTYQRAKEFANNLHVKYIETSAKDGTGVQELLQTLAQDILLKSE